MTDGRPRAGATDVARLMEEIKERVRERKASGFYSEEDVRRITQMELELTESAPTFSDEIEQHLGVLNDGWDTAADPVITSHRAGVGYLIVSVKRLLRKLTRPYITLVLARQVEFNSTLLHLLNSFVLPIRDEVQGGLSALTRRIEDLSLSFHERLAVEHGERQRSQRDLVDRLATLTGGIEALRAEVERLRTPAPATGLPPAPAVPARLPRPLCPGLAGAGYRMRPWRVPGAVPENRDRSAGRRPRRRDGGILPRGRARGRARRRPRHARGTA